MAENKMKIHEGQHQKNLAREETRELKNYLLPAVDIYETDEGLVLLADLPGVAKDALEINIEQGLLTIEGCPGQGVSGEEVISEFALSRFYRQFRLPDTLDGAGSSAVLKDGVLAITLPRAAAAKPRRIEVTQPGS